MKTFKFLTFMFLSLTFSFVSCSSDDDDDNGGGKEKEEIKKQIEEITSDLSKNQELSAFTEAFKALDANTVDTKELTLFAFKDEVLESELKAASEISQELLKRHITKGAYTIDQLKKLKEVLSLNGDKLKVTTDSTGTVNINGVPLGSPQKVSNSIIFLIDQMLPASAIDSAQNNVTIKVMECNRNWSSLISPQEGFPAENALIKIYKSDNSLYQTIKTDRNGQASFSWQSNLKLYYSVEKEGSKNLYNNWQIAGIFTSIKQVNQFGEDYPDNNLRLGGLKFKDINGDGKIDNNDKIAGNIQLPSGNESIEVFISSEADSPSIGIDKVESVFFNIDNTLSTLAKRQESAVNPNNTLLTEFWMESYSAIDMMNSVENSNNSDHNIALARKYKGQIYAMLPTVFGDVPILTNSIDTMPARSSVKDVYEYAIYDLDAAILKLPAKEKTEALITKAFVFMQRVVATGDVNFYYGAYEAAKQALDMGTIGWTIGGNNESYIKLSLIYAEAANETDRIMEAMQTVNNLYQAVGLPTLLPNGSTKEQVRNGIKAAYDNSNFAVKGSKYANISRWAQNSTWGKYQLLPIPQKAINNSGGIITQNPGW